MSTRREAILLLALTAVPSAASAGAWSHESFANDGALDWIAEFQEKPTPDFLRDTLLQGTKGEYIENFTGEGIVAAAEVVAASLGHATASLPKEVAPLVAKSAALFRPLAPPARVALSAGVLGTKSEVRENWSLRAESLARWSASVNELLARLEPRVA